MSARGLSAPVPGVLSEADAMRVENAFGVGRAQVERDHLISHLLASLARSVRDDVVFIGGTALARTHLPALRLSEDIDLIARAPRSGLGRRIEGTLVADFARSFGQIAFTPAFDQTRDSEPVLLSAPGRTRVQIQLLDGVGRPHWPTELAPIEQRYSDAPPAELRVPTIEAFAAMKLSAWHDRRAPRDLYDLYALQRTGAINNEAKRLYRNLGPGVIISDLFSGVSTQAEWDDALSHQCRPTVGPDEALEVVRDAWMTSRSDS